jgi:Ribbon-helix-helix protein, copG family
MRYHQEATVSDLLIRDIPDDVVAAIDARAARLGLSRTEYLRRRLAQDAALGEGTVTVDDLERFADMFAGLVDPSVMDQAWR